MMRTWHVILLSVLFLPACLPPSPTAPAVPTTSTVLYSPAPSDTTAEARYTTQRQRMVETIVARDVSDEQVLAAMRSVPRHEFVPPDVVLLAYADRPLPIGYGQTISQPYIVAYMTELLGLKGGERVLEIGTGSGYQAAILAAMGVEVYSVEIIPELHERAKACLARLGYNVHTLRADGYHGWAEHAPYDAIIVTAAPDHIPPPLVQQLKPNGRLVIPVGPPGAFQTLWLVTRREDGEVDMANQGGCIFVPFTREE